MQPLHRGPLGGLVGQLLLLSGLAVTVGLGPVGWVVGLVAAGGVTALLSRALRRRGESRLGAANAVTLGRAGLVVGVSALVGASFTDRGSEPVLVTLAAVALVLDAVDGRVARHTDTASELGARFDLEVDALLILVLSAYVAASLGWWVLLIGAARYLLLAAAVVFPWLRRTSPPRHWSKVVAAVQGVVLTVAAAEVLPRPVTVTALLGALALLTESFGRQTWVLWRLHRGREPTLPTLWSRPPARVSANVVACLLVWGALTLPHRSSELSPSVLLGVPVEAVALLALVMVVPARAARAVGVLAGALLGVMVLVKLLDLGFRMVLDRPFDPLNDWFYLGPGYGVLTDSVGPGRALLAATVAAALATALLLALPWAVVRLRRIVHADRRRAGWVLVAFAAVWAVGAALGLQVVPGVDVASSSTSALAFEQLQHARDNLADRRRFAREIEHDPLAERAGDGLLAGLEGKDVLVVFVESYGRVAVDGTLSGSVVEALDAGTATLRGRGYGMRSAYLTSPTFGAASWLAHATLQSGVWVDSQQRYDQLLATDRLTLTRAFDEQGWRTVFQVPANTRPWPQGSAFYGYDELHDASDVGYRGPKLGYAPMPDQYTLAAFDRLELAPEDRPPVMAEIDLVSSHHPWTPLPDLVPWESLGDGSLYSAAADRGPSAEEAFGDPERVKDLYLKSLVYTWRTLVSFLARHADDGLVVVVLGDHQPHSYVTGPSAGREVPVTVVSTDPAVLRSIREWRWQPGLRPGPDAPVWPMDEFRDAFLTAFSPRR